MASDPQRVERLSVAGAFCLFDKKLRASGNSSIVWGGLNLLIGGVIVAANDRWGLVSLLLGLALIAAGVYERTVRDPKVIILSAATLALLAVWDFALVGLAAMGKVELALGGRTLYWALAQAWGAFATWKTYSTYKMLREKSDPLTVEQVRGYIDELKKVKPAQSVDLVEFEANAGFVQGNNRYRLKPVEDLYLIALQGAAWVVDSGRVELRPAQPGDAHSRRRKMDEQGDQGHRAIGATEARKSEHQSRHGSAPESRRTSDCT